MAAPLVDNKALFSDRRDESDCLTLSGYWPLSYAEPAGDVVVHCSRP